MPTFRGEVVYLFAFDVANEIVTAKVHEILSRKPFPYEIRIDRNFPKDIPLYKPLALDLPDLGPRLRGLSVQVLVRIYDVGVVSVTMRVPIESETLAELIPFHQPVVDDGRHLDRAAKDLCGEICKELAAVMVKPKAPSEPEAYTAFCLTEIDGSEDAHAWLGDHRLEVAGLLTEADPGRLSQEQIGEALRIVRSFEKTDLVVVDWDSALVIDLTGYVDDVLYVLELANLQLEEFRVMDLELDRYLNTVYDDLGRGLANVLGVPSSTLRQLRRFRIDVTKLADEVTNITKFFGDWYLARVYLGARDRFHLDKWHQSVEQRLSNLDRIYEVWHAQIYESRMLWLEVAIVILFLMDILLIVFVKH